MATNDSLKRNPDANTTESAGDAKKRRKQVRVWVDGCFDMMHFGHANAIRQAKQMGDYLIAGVHTDADIATHKGPPIMNERERYEAVRGCKWVDEVIEGAPYVTQLSDLEKYNIDFVVHGDDITTDEHGNDTYQAIKDAGKYKECKRTSGVSTTDLVGRMLLLQKHPAGNVSDELSQAEEQQVSQYTRASKFLPTSKKIIQFASNNEPKTGDKIVYVCGAFDLFHVGHIEFLKRAKALGDYLICGIHNDSDVARVRGQGNPLCSLHERTLGVLQCKYVDECVIGAPYEVDKDLIQHFKVDVVAHGGTEVDDLDGRNPYQAAIDANIFQKIDSGSDLTAQVIIQRIIENRLRFELRNKKKNEKELRIQAAQASREASKSPKKIV
eukprot:m.198293 g.198293  ORF g.198293 m.198293 type:complete len:383 (+) comp18740_c0_seq12:231-1379(+)